MWLRLVERILRDRSAAEDVKQGLRLKVQTVRDDSSIENPHA
jgi:hypothetical protein